MTTDAAKRDINACIFPSPSLILVEHLVQPTGWYADQTLNGMTSRPELAIEPARQQQRVITN